MLTLKSLSHVHMSRDAKSFRSCPQGTGVPLAGVDHARILLEGARRIGRETRRVWFDVRWRRHLERYRLKKTR